MGLFTKTKTPVSANKKKAEQNDRETRRLIESNESVIQQIENGEKTKKPNVFVRFWNWLKGIFGKKNTETADGGDAAEMFEQTNVQAPDAEPSATLSPFVTDEGVSEISELPQEEEETEFPSSVTIGKMTFSVNAGEDGGLHSSSGTVSLFGKTLSWDSENDIEITRSDSGYSAAGSINASEPNFLSFKNVSFSAENDNVLLTKGSDSQVTVVKSGIAMELKSAEFDGVDSLSGTGITVTNRTHDGIEGNPEFQEGKITINGSEIKTEGAEKALEGWTYLPYFIAEHSGLSLKLEDEGEQLSEQITVADTIICFINTFPLKFRSLLKKDMSFAVDENGKAKAKLPEVSYSASFFDGKFVKNIAEIPDFDWQTGENAKQLTVNFEDLELGGFALSGLSLAVGGGVFLNVAELSSKEDEKLSGENISFTISDKAVIAESAKIGYNDPDGIGSLVFSASNIGLSAEAGIIFDDMSAIFSEFKAGPVTLHEGKIILKNDENAFTMVSEGVTASISTGDGEEGKNIGIAAESENVPISLSYSRNKGQEGFNLGSFCASFNGELNLTLKMDGEDIAEASAENISAANGGVYIEKADGYFNLEESEENPASFMGSVHLDSILIARSGISMNAKLYLSNVKYKGSEIANELEMSYLSGTKSWELVVDPNLPEFKFKFGGFDITASDFKFAANYGGKKLHLGFNETNISLSGGSHHIEGENVTFMLGEVISADSLSYSNDTINEAVNSFFPDTSLSMSINGITLENGGEHSFEGIGITLEKEVNLFGSGFKFTDITAAINCKNLASFEGFSVSLGLAYEGGKLIDSVSGKGTVNIVKNGDSFGFGNVVFENVSVKIKGYGEASVGSISKEGDIYTFEDVSVTMADDRDEESGESESGGSEDKCGSLLTKMVKYFPQANYAVENMTYDRQGFHVDPKDIKLKQFSGDIDITDNLKGTLGYSAEERTLSLGLKGEYYAPESRKDDQSARKTLLAVGFPFSPFPFLKAEVGAHLDAGVDFSADFLSEYNFGKKRFDLGGNAGGSADVAAGLYGKIGISVAGAGVEGKVTGDFVGSASGDLKAGTAIVYTPAPSLKDSLSIDKTATSADYFFKLGISFQLGFDAGFKVPPIFDAENKNLYKSWKLLDINLGEVELKGRAEYGEDGTLTVNNETAVRGFSDLHPIDVDKIIQPENLQKLSDKANELDALNMDIYKILEENPDCIGFGAVRSAAATELANIISKQIVSASNESVKNSKIIFESISRIQETLPKIIHERNVRHVQLGRKQELLDSTNQAMEILGAVNEGQYSSLAEFKQSISEIGVGDLGEEKTESLAKLDPLGVYNMFKIYKSTKARSWGALYERAVALSEAMHSTKYAVPKKSLADNVKDSEQEKREFEVLSENLKNADGISKEGKEKQAEYYQRLLELNTELDELNKKKTEISMDSTLSPEKRSKKLAEIFKKVNEAVKKKTELVDKWYSEKDENIDEKKGVLKHYLELGKKRIDETKKSHNDKVEASLAEYDPTLRPQEEYIENNKKFVIDLVNQFKEDRSASSEKERKVHSEQIQERLKLTEKGEFAEHELAKQFKSVSNSQRNDAAADNLDKIRKAYDAYMDRALQFQNIYTQADLLYYDLYKKRYSEFSDSAAAENKELAQSALSVRKLNEELNKPGNRFTDSDIAAVNDLNAKVDSMLKETQESA